MTQARQRAIHSFLCLMLLVLSCTAAYAQAGSQGAISITITDSSGGLIPQAGLELVEKATNYPHKAETSENGNYTFVNLNIGEYRLSVSRNGFATTVLESITVHASQTTSIVVPLKIGKAEETVSVSADQTPLLDVSSNSITSVIDLKQIETLPFSGRDLTALASLVPGYADGSWNGQPLINQGNNIDGVVSSSSRSKYVGNSQAAASPRIENIAEMAVGTDMTDLDSGFGQSSMQISYVTRSGTNHFHGRIYGDFRNAGLNANSYYNDWAGVRKGKLIYNDFGVSVGGPILKDKLFFFGSISTRRVPETTYASNSYLSSAAQTGEFTYTGTDGAKHTVNVLSMAANAGLTSSVNSSVASQLSVINNSLTSGTTSTTTDPNLGNIAWNQSTPEVFYWPTARLDYNATSRLHLYLSWNMSQSTENGTYAAPFPGSDFANHQAGYLGRSFTGGFGADYTITPQLVNSFKAGYLYNNSEFSTDAEPLWDSNPSIYWAIASSGQYYNLPVTEYYPVINFSDTLSWQKGSHSIKFGGGWSREQDHYWNPPTGFNNIYLGLASGDPALGVFTSSTLPDASTGSITEAQNLYATLAGRISYVGGTYAYSQETKSYNHSVGAYNLDERQSAGGIFFQDSWRVKPTLTLNYGLRWDFTGDNYDLTGAYHSITKANILGPSVAPFQPGVFGGNTNPTIDTIIHAYKPYYIAPQPQFGFAWNPSGDSEFGKILGQHATVIRGGFSLRRFTEPEQFYWNNASSYGAFFYQTFYLNANNTGTTGTFSPGSLALGDTIPEFGYSPAAYQVSEPQSDFTFYNSQTFGGMDRDLKQPYTESWNFGIERRFGPRVLEIRYVGNRTLHQWTAINENEVNVFENGFLQQFKNAQANLAASGGTTFKGALPTPIFDAAFAGEATGQYGHLADYDNGIFTTALQNGNVGAVAATLSGVSGTAPYFCNLVGSSFAPCLNNAGYSGSGAGYASNFFQANPFAAGQSTTLMEALGYSNYNSLQVDLRQSTWKGWVFDANYTYGKVLGSQSTSDWTAGVGNLFTIRDTSIGYGPAPYDTRHAIRFTTTYDLPFGRGKMFLNSNNLLSRMLGDWSIGSIMKFTTGLPARLTGGNTTYNDYADGGVTLNGVTSKDIQKSVAVHRVPGQYYATLIGSKFLANPTGGANQSLIAPNSTPGTIGQIIRIYGPHAFAHDMSVTKTFPIRDQLNFRFQSAFINAWNHPTWGSLNAAVNDSNAFGVGYINNSPRVIEFRANIEF